MNTIENELKFIKHIYSNMIESRYDTLTMALQEKPRTSVIPTHDVIVTNDYCPFTDESRITIRLKRISKEEAIKEIIEYNKELISKGFDISEEWTEYYSKVIPSQSSL